MPSVNQPNIEITLEGLQMVFVDPKNEKCTVGVLRDAPAEHPFNITVQKYDAAGHAELVAKLKGADINANLEIEVSNTSKSGITRRKMDVEIDRLSGWPPDHADSFKWVVDFERELFKRPMSERSKTEGFLSRLTINNGELLARALSQNLLLTRKGLNGPFKEFGRVATQTGIDIVLDQPDSRAVFKNGDEVIFTADSNSMFTVFIERVCSAESGGSDADAYHTLFGEMSDDEKIFFSSTELNPKNKVAAEPGVGPMPPTTPDASCLPGTGGG